MMTFLFCFVDIMLVMLTFLLALFSFRLTMLSFMLALLIFMLIGAMLAVLIISLDKDKK